MLLHWIRNYDKWLRFDDGFRRQDQDDALSDLKFVDETADAVYLHGALHLYEHNDAAFKRRRDPDVQFSPILDTVRGFMKQQHYPLMVAEGSSEAKRAKIAGSRYLSWASRRLCTMKGGLVTLGCSFSNDRHILDAVMQSQTQTLWVGVYGEQGDTDNVQLVNRVREAHAARSAQLPTMELGFFDSSTANPWNPSQTETAKAA